MKRIFIVEDQELVLESYLMLFEFTDGLEVVGTARTVAGALAAIPDAAPDLVLTDLTLPDMSGLELVRRLAGDAPPVLVVSGHDDELYRREAEQSGVCGFVLKQDGPDRLMEAIHRSLRAPRGEPVGSSQREPVNRA